MTPLLSSVETQLTQALVNLGYAHAARSFAAIARRPVSVEAMPVRISCSAELPPLAAFPGGALTVLTTAMLGNIPGTSLLVLDEQECQEIFRLCLPASTSNRVAMEDAILLEIDNMLAAAVITQFANVLSLEMYGGVPRLNRTDQTGLQTMLTEAITETGTCEFLFSSTRLVLENEVTVQPVFIWIMPAAFLNAIKQVVQTDTKAPEKLETNRVSWQGLDSASWHELKTVLTKPPQ